MYIDIVATLKMEVASSVELLVPVFETRSKSNGPDTDGNDVNRGGTEVKKKFREILIGCPCEECRPLGCKNTVRTSQETCLRYRAQTD
jgi:hypothetical protein